MASNVERAAPQPAQADHSAALAPGEQSSSRTGQKSRLRIVSKRGHSSGASMEARSPALQPENDHSGSAIPGHSAPLQRPHSGVIEAILKVGSERKLLLGELRSALVSGQDSEALGVARRLCGLAA